MSVFIFLLTGLGICYPIKDYWLHCFTALNFTHCTSTPLFQLGGKVYVRRSVRVHIFAWGKSGPSSSKSQESSIHQTSERMDCTFFQKVEKLIKFAEHVMEKFVRHPKGKSKEEHPMEKSVVA